MKTTKCPSCDGDGYVFVDSEPYPGEGDLHTCSSCSGTGKVLQVTTIEEASKIGRHILDTGISTTEARVATMVLGSKHTTQPCMSCDKHWKSEYVDLYAKISGVIEGLRKGDSCSISQAVNLLEKALTNKF